MNTATKFILGVGILGAAIALIANATKSKASTHKFNVGDVIAPNSAIISGNHDMDQRITAITSTQYELTDITGRLTMHLITDIDSSFSKWF